MLLDKIEQKLDSVLSLLQTYNGTHSKVTFNVEEAAVYLGIARSTLYKHTSLGNIAHYKPNGKLISFRRADLDKWLEMTRVPCNQELEQNLSTEKNNYNEKH